MLTIIDEKEQRTAEIVEKDFLYAVFLMINCTGLENPKGYLYCVSTLLDRQAELNNIASDFSQRNSLI